MEWAHYCGGSRFRQAMPELFEKCRIRGASCFSFRSYALSTIVARGSLTQNDLAAELYLDKKE
jgi:hypothetical protein